MNRELEIGKYSLLNDLLMLIYKVFVGFKLYSFDLSRKGSLKEKEDTRDTLIYNYHNGKWVDGFKVWILLSTNENRVEVY